MPSDGDAAFHAEIISDVHSEVVKRIEGNPDIWIPVREVVELYIEIRNEAKSKRAARTFLAPFGLTKETFLDRMATMEPGLVARISEDMVSYNLPSLSVIIAGIDPTGPHIYEVHDGESGCLDAIGYAAIGVGARHARAHFMMSGQSFSSSVAETLWSTYLAKKRSEVAPGVGEATDLAMIGPQLGGNVHFNSNPGNPTIIKQLESVYKKTKKMEEKARKIASKEMVEYVKKIGREAAQQVTTQASPETTPNNPGNGS